MDKRDSQRRGSARMRRRRRARIRRLAKGPAAFLVMAAVFAVLLLATDGAEEEAARQEAEEIQKSIEDYNARKQAEAEAAFREMQKEYETKVPEQYDDIPLLWNMVEAEAGNQDLMGKRLVACVALNRVDDGDWPDTLTGVITQPYQFSSYWDGGMEKFSEISESTMEAVALELEERSYPGLFYFTAEGYSSYGTPYFKYGDHYFSTK